MSRRTLLMIAVISAAAILAIAAICLHSPEWNRMMDENRDVVAIQDFEVLDSHTGTWTKGSVIVQRSDDGLLLRIIGSLNVAEEDIGGVYFYLEKDMEPESILTSYRDDPSASGVLVERIPFDKPYPGGKSVSMGRTPETGGGDGFFEMTCRYVGDASVDRLSILIAVGSYYDVDHWVLGGSFESYTISI